VPRSRPAPRAVAALVFLLALALRLAYLAEARDSVFFRALGLDAKYYDDEALRILSGTLPAEPFFMGPLYAYFLAFVYRIAGHSYDAVRVLQALMGAATALAAARIGTLLAGRTAGLLAGLLVAIYPPLVFYSGSILYPSLAALLDTGVVLFLLEHERTRRGRDLAIAGILLGASAVGQATVLAVAPGVVAWLWLLERRDLRRTARRAAPFLVGLALPIAPITARNVLVGGEPVLLTTNGGLNFYIGNGPEATGGYVKPKGLDVYEDPSGRGLLSRRAGRALTARETDRAWMDAGVAHVREDPARFAALLVRKFVFYWGAAEIPQIENFEFQKSESRVVSVVDALPLGFGVLGPLAGVGAIALAAEARRRRALARRLAPPILFVALYSATIIVFFVISRYRLPVVPLLLVFAGAALARGGAAARALAGAARPQAPAPAAAAPPPPARALAARGAAVAALALAAFSLLVNANPYRVSNRSGFAQCHFRLGIVARQEGRIDEALARYRDAIALDPNYAPSRVNLAEILAARGDRAAALNEFREAARIDPEYPKAQYNLGVAAAQMGEWDEARTALERAGDLAPRSADSWFGIGAVRTRDGDWAGARDAFDQMGRLAQARGDGERARSAANLTRLAARLAQIEGAAGPVPAEMSRRAPSRAGARAAALWSVVGETALAGAILRPGAAAGEGGAPGGAAAAPTADPVVLYVLGDFLVATGRPADGEPILRRALEHAPRLPFAHFSLGAARALANDPTGAAREFALETEANPKNAEAHFNLAVLALEHRGDRAAAVEHLRACAALGGEKAAEAREMLKRLGAGPG
jgi:tetratricopeptide (TPR) repeat protein